MSKWHENDVWDSWETIKKLYKNTDDLPAFQRNLAALIILSKWTKEEIYNYVSEIFVKNSLNHWD